MKTFVTILCIYVCVFNTALFLTAILESWRAKIGLQQTKSCVEKTGNSQ